MKRSRTSESGYSAKKPRLSGKQMIKANTDDIIIDKMRSLNSIFFPDSGLVGTEDYRLLAQWFLRDPAFYSELFQARTCPHCGKIYKELGKHIINDVSCSGQLLTTDWTTLSPDLQKEIRGVLCGWGTVLDEEEEEEIDSELNHEFLVQQYIKYVKDSEETYEVGNFSLSAYNRKIDNDLSKVESKVREICDQQTSSFKIQICMGYVLRDLETGDVRLFYASRNTNVLPELREIFRPSQVTDLLNTIRNYDWDNYFHINQPKSGMLVDKVPYIRVYVYRTKQLIGAICHNENIPLSLKKNRHILDASRAARKCNNLCMFRDENTTK